MKFTKMHGCANDYIYIDCREKIPDDPSKLSRILSDRHTGIGSDGLVLICSSDKADLQMRMFNADGSESPMCGNAIRCVGKYAYERGITDKTELDIETGSGIRHLTLNVKDGTVMSVSVDMGKPVIKTLAGNIYGYEYSDISVGNPHCVIFTDCVEKINIFDLGRKIENSTSVFPDRTNVEFVEVTANDQICMRVWERGSGETMACGTGACAAAVAAVEKMLCVSPVTVRLNGGTLIVEYDGCNVKLTGPAEFVFDGETAIEE